MDTPKQSEYEAVVETAPEPIEAEEPIVKADPEPVVEPVVEGGTDLDASAPPSSTSSLFVSPTSKCAGCKRNGDGSLYACFDRVIHAATNPDGIEGTLNITECGSFLPSEAR